MIEAGIPHTLQYYYSILREKINMNKGFFSHCSKALLIPTAFFLIAATAEVAGAQTRVYNPISINPGAEVSDSLTDQDIPTGEQGFARDYVVNLTSGDQVTIDLASDSFDAVVILLANDGTTVGQNDDGTDGTTNSLLFVRIKETGRYIVRVRAFGPTGSGPFKLKVTRLRPIE